MTYTTLMLGALGVLGIFMHNLVKLNDLNKASNGNLNLAKYLSLEKFGILLSMCVVACALIAQSEIKQMEQVGNYLGLAFVAIGYMAQSIVVSFMGKASKFISNQNEKHDN